MFWSSELQNIRLLLYLNPNYQKIEIFQSKCQYSIQYKIVKKCHLFYNILRIFLVPVIELLNYVIVSNYRVFVP